MRFAPAFSFLFALVASSCAGLTAPDGTAPPRRIAFFGNSLTADNQLASLVEALADAMGIEPRIETAQYASDAANLEDHWLGGAQEIIDSARFDVVVLQQGPSSAAENRVHLRVVAARFGERVRAAGGNVAMLMVWPDSRFVEDFTRTSDSYRLAAEDARGYLLPAGETWLEAWRRDIAMPLYAADGFHPSLYGSYAAALSIVGVLFDRATVGLPARLIRRDGRVVDIHPADALVLQQAADAANRRFGRRP